LTFGLQIITTSCNDLQTHGRIGTSFKSLSDLAAFWLYGVYAQWWHLAPIIDLPILHHMQLQGAAMM
jgi:hypothetical protein